MITLSKTLLKKLYYIEKKTRKEIAIELGYSLSTIKRNFKRYCIYKVSEQPDCVDCGKKIAYYRKRCMKCEMKHRITIGMFKGKNHPNYKHGKKYNARCKNCHKHISYLSWKYGKGKCKKCAGKDRQIHTFCIDCGMEISRKIHKRCRKCHIKFYRGKNHPQFGKPAYHGKGQYYKQIWMRSYYEVAYATYLNKKRIKWMYEFKTFDLRNGLTYTPDFYLPEKDLWIEIKGWWRDDAKYKFNRFKRLYRDIKIRIITEKGLVRLGINPRARK